jgi:hypothetical protein
VERTRDHPTGRTGSYQWRPLLVVGLFWLTSLAFVVCGIQGMLGYPFRRTIALDTAKFVWAGGFAYSSALPSQYSPRGAQAASARLRENGRVISSYSQRETSVAKVGRGIFSVPERGRLLFSSTDNSDPRTNGRKYSIEVPLRVSKWALPICFAAWLAMAVFLVFKLADGREVALLTTKRVVIAMASMLAFFGEWPAIILSIPSVYLLSSYAPLWKDVDALGQLAIPASDLNILHFPPVYCFLGRIPFAITSWLAGAGGHGTVQSLFEQQMPSLMGIYLLVVIQHILLIAALTYTVLSLTSSRLLRALFALSLAFASANYTQAQCCGSEALSVSATFALIAAGFSILRGSRQVAWIVYGVALFLAIGSRHINVLFAIWLPFTTALLGFATKIGWCTPRAEGFRWQTFVSAISIGLLTIGLNIGIARSMIAAVHDEYRSTLGRTLSDRIGTFLDKLSSSDRLRLAQDLCAKTSDPALRMAIESQAKVGSFYNGSAQAIADYLVQTHVPAAKISVERDRLVLGATTRYLMTLHPILLSVIWQDFVKGLIRADNSQIAMSPFQANVFCAVDKIKRPEAWAELAALPGVDLVQATVTWDAASRDPYVNFGRAMPIGGLILLDLLLGGIACVIDRAIPRTVLIGWSALATGIVVFAANSVCVYYMERYTLPMLVAALIALLSALDWIAHQSLEICERSRLRKAAVSFCNS